ncbi:MAG: hypothetical protein ABII82_06485 [Verrucomicrobiota bacterium]
MKFPLLTVVLLPAASALCGADLQPLLDNSPFGRPPVAESTTVPAAEAPLEFRSLIVEDGRRYFSVFDPSAQRGHWVAEDDADNQSGITVSSYDDEAHRLVVSHGGRTYELLLKQANILAGAVPAPVALTNNGNNHDRGRPTVNNVADARRLEAVAAEVRRRRALRQAAAANATGQ